MSAREGEILTLEPFMEAVREGVEETGWRLSGLQKTTSHQFEGRWEGESTRSAYLFFHRDAGPEYASIDVYLDETSRGLTGNLALVLDLVPLADLGTAERALGALGTVGGAALPADYRTPLTLRLRLEDGTDEPESAEVEVRFKLRIPRRSIDAGPDAIRSLASETVAAFEAILASHGLEGYVGAGE